MVVFIRVMLHHSVVFREYTSFQQRVSLPRTVMFIVSSC